MKKLFTLAIFAMLLAFIGCENEVTLETPDVSFTVATGDNGGTLTLDWDEITDADGYYIYADGVKIDSVTTTSYDATTPAALYEVSAYAGSDESGKDQVDCGAVETGSIVVYGSGDTSPDHPSGFGFNAAGNATTYSISDQSNWPYIDYWIHSVSANEQEFASPNQASTPFNDEVNTTKNSGETNYDAVTICDAPGGYTAPTTINANAVYYFWIDPDNDGWGTGNDHFGKIQVVGVNGYAVTMKIAYQAIAGLRWCVVE
ncbi:MAG: hypothetical protein ACPL28_02215 [bacterium]